MHLFLETQLQLKTRWKVMLEFTTHVQFGLTTNQVSASRVNPVFWLDKITRESPYTRVKKIEEIQASETSKSHGAIHAVSFRGGGVAEGSARRTRNPAVPGSRPALATYWICSRSSRVQILGHACKLTTGCLLPVGVLNPLMLYFNYLFLSIWEEWACELVA